MPSFTPPSTSLPPLARSSTAWPISPRGPSGTGAGHRLTFTLTQSNAPGLHSMAEDWVVTPDPADPAGRAILTTEIGIQAVRLLRPFPGLVRAALKGPLRGAAGITAQFP